MPTIGGALATARRAIGAVEARILLAHMLGKDQAHIASYPDAPLSAEQAAAFEAVVDRRARGEPVAYLTGRREFYGLDFCVSPSVLIPRPETELLVELALERIPLEEARRVLDLGTGSGCIAISIAHQRPHARIFAVERSCGALAVARKNASRLGVDNVSFAEGDWFESVAERQFDLIVSNPPYVAEGDPHLAQGDLRFEPQSALIAGADGLAAIRDLIARAGRHLAQGGVLLVEHGYDQGPACRALLQAAGFREIGTWRDLAGHERVSGGRYA